MIFEKYEKIKDYFYNTVYTNIMEIIMCMSLVFLLGYSIYNKFKGNKGTWTDFEFIKKNIKTEDPSVNAYLVRKHINIDSRSKKTPKKSKGEKEVHEALERIFQKPFYHGRPNFLKNPINNYNLELDCYNSEIGLAVEYNGEQHYKYIPFFHQNKEAFTNQLYRDELKRRLCKEAGVVLIEVPYTVSVKNIESYLKNIINNYKTGIY
jgi:hypothetical protein